MTKKGLIPFSIIMAIFAFCMMASEQGSITQLFATICFAGMVIHLAISMLSEPRSLGIPTSSLDAPIPVMDESIISSLDLTRVPPAKAQAVCASLALRTGKVYIANMNRDGTFHIKEM